MSIMENIKEKEDYLESSISDASDYDKSFIEKDLEIEEQIEKLHSQLEEVVDIGDQAYSQEPSFQGIFETWDSIKTFDARILEITDSVVSLDCVVDRENEIHQEREFEKYLFEHLKIEKGDYIVIRKFTKPGKISFTINRGAKLVDKSNFEDLPEFSDLDAIENEHIDLGSIE